MIQPKNNDNAVSLMFSLPGVPCIYYGDEAGLTGGKDPNNRKFFPWDNIDPTYYKQYQKWSNYRTENEVLRSGDFSTFYCGDLLGIIRYTENDYFVTLINPSDQEIRIDFNAISFFTKFRSSRRTQGKIRWTTN
ncbi:alpha-amylase family glycosyl hydrolase [Lactococcus fujiensis]|uniref:alpha-amylase family glycosyl hydrolase n=1 Tax=Lactococcus fujiensis TaxID=610251 RepID=UPI002092D025|nr:alpha-amylase family glycosyl hydrolase [Lactococcus fujiensis]